MADLTTPDITIPEEALEAAAKDLKLLLADLVDADTRATELTDEEHIVLANSACLAMLRAWPGMTSIKWDGQLIIHLKTPLPQENQ